MTKRTWHYSSKNKVRVIVYDDNSNIGHTYYIPVSDAVRLFENLLENPVFPGAQ